MPCRPSVPSLLHRSAGKRFFASISAARGAISASANCCTLSRSMPIVSPRSKARPGRWGMTVSWELVSPSLTSPGSTSSAPPARKKAPRPRKELPALLAKAAELFLGDAVGVRKKHEVFGRAQHVAHPAGHDEHVVRRQFESLFADAQLTATFGDDEDSAVAAAIRP